MSRDNCSSLIATSLLAGLALPTIMPAAGASQDSDAAAAAADDHVVLMERFVVSASRIEEKPWRYASFPGFEVLSRASDSDTNWWLEALQRGQRLEDEVLPAEWLPQSPVPCTVIIDDTNPQDIRTGQPHLKSIVFRPPVDEITWGRFAADASVWAGHFEAHDADAFASNTNVHDIDTRRPACTAMRLERLFRCTPPLPKWLMEGLLGTDFGIFREGFVPVIEPPIDASIIPGENLGSVRRVVGPGTLWASLDETQRLLSQLKKNKRLAIPIPPLAGLFAEMPPADENLSHWRSSAALFVRWGLMGPGHEDPALSRSFLEFVRRARREPVTEQLFAACFGYGYAAMEERLAAFLRSNLAEPTSVELTRQPSLGKVEFKIATNDQIGRILGDWMRMQGNSIRASDPATGEEFLRAAGRMLLRAYCLDNGLPLPPEGGPTAEKGRKALSTSDGAAKPISVAAARIRDPALLPIFGLYEHDIGDDEKARECLEAAGAAGARRPGAMLVLAELRYSESIAKPEGKNGKLGAQQAAAIIGPLRSTLQDSANSDAYTLMARTWDHCEAKPDARDLDTLIEGVSRFPRITGLSYRSAAICAQCGEFARAIQVIDKALGFATNDDDKDHLKRLRALLVGPAAPAAK